jgi:hypothetical protein
VLCYLQGKPQDEAAAELGLPKGTLKGRLEAARAVEGAPHPTGFGPAAALLASVWPASAALPPALVPSTACAATRVAGGSAIRAAAPSAVASLTEGVIKPAFLMKVRLALLAVAIATALGAHVPSFRRAVTNRRDPRTTGLLRRERRVNRPRARNRRPGDRNR